MNCIIINTSFKIVLQAKKGRCPVSISIKITDNLKETKNYVIKIDIELIRE